MAESLIGLAWRAFQRYREGIAVEADYPRYEQKQRLAHVSEADRRFNTSQLEREIDDIQHACLVEGQVAFKSRIQPTESIVEKLRPEIRQLRARFDQLARDYQGELNQLHHEKEGLLDEKQKLFEEMKSLREQRSQVQRKLSEAHDDMKRAKTSISNWHDKANRSPWLFGNGGKRLPNHSFCGQSQGDIEEYKRDRERAYEKIGECKAAIARITGEQEDNRAHQEENKATLNRVFNSITAVKAERQRMIELKNQGYRLHWVEAQLSELLRQETMADKELARISSERAEYVVQQSYRMGMGERKEAVAQMKMQRAQFVAEFDDPVQLANRRKLHREWWLKNRKAKKR